MALQTAWSPNSTYILESYRIVISVSSSKGLSTTTLDIVSAYPMFVDEGLRRPSEMPARQEPLYFD